MSLCKISLCYNQAMQNTHQSQRKVQTLERKEKFADITEQSCEKQTIICRTNFSNKNVKSHFLYDLINPSNEK